MKIVVIFLFCLIIQGCTAESSSMLQNDESTKEALRSFQLETKFLEDSTSFYPGAPDEEIRVRAESLINNAVKKLIETPEDGLNEEKFWEILKVAALELKTMDSEELERGLTYMEELMDIYGIESSGGRLNKWRYGFDPSARQKAN